MSVKWSDGRTEGLAGNLPEYLVRDLQLYFKELEDLRYEHDNDLRDDEYDFCSVNSTRNLTNKLVGLGMTKDERAEFDFYNRRG